MVFGIGEKSDYKKLATILIECSDDKEECKIAMDNVFKLLRKHIVDYYEAVPFENRSKLELKLSPNFKLSKADFVFRIVGKDYDEIADLKNTITRELKPKLVKSIELVQ